MVLAPGTEIKSKTHTNFTRNLMSILMRQKYYLRYS